MSDKRFRIILILCLLIFTIFGVSCSQNANELTELENNKLDIPETDSNNGVEDEDKKIESKDETKNNVFETEIDAEDYKNALDDKTKAHILEVAKNYYDNLNFLKIKSIEITNDYINYKGKGIEDEYSVGNILIFDVKSVQDDSEYRRIISIAKDNSGEWKVINEGFK